MGIIVKQGWMPGTFPLIVIAVQLSLVLSVIFDIPLVRQVLGFLFLTFLPGYAIIRLLRMKLGRVEIVLFSVGLSLGFLMISTFLLNLILPSLGVAAPLTTIPLLVVANSVVIILEVSEWRSSGNFEISAKLRKVLFFGTLITLPLILTIVGIFMVRIPPHSNNTILLAMILTIAFLVTFIIIAKKSLNLAIYPVILFIIAIALLFHTSLFSNHLQGGDIFSENLVFRITDSSSYWNPALLGRLSAMLSITILPTIYSKILNIDPIWLMKILYPLFFAFVPLGLYQLFRSKINKEMAFLAVFFFMSNLVFFNEVSDLSRQIVAELFYILLFVTLFSKSVKGSAKWILCTIFMFGLVVSHYAIAYIFLAFILVTWTVGFIRKKHSNVTTGFIILMGILTFSWYIYVSQASNFSDLLSSITYLRNSLLVDLVNPQSRSSQVLAAVGASGDNSVWHLVGRSVYYVTMAFIVAGFLFQLLKKRLSYLDDDYNVLVFCNLALLAACIVVPNFSSTFNASRFYHITSFFLAPLVILGGLEVLKLLTRKRIRDKYLVFTIVLVVLVPFFLFQTGFVYEVTGEQSYSTSLSSYRQSSLMISNNGILTDSEFSGGVWLADHQVPNSTIYGDISSGSIFVSTNVQNFLSFSGANVPESSLIFLRDYNVKENIVYTDYFSGGYIINQAIPNIDSTQQIYSSGSAVVLEVP